LVVVVGICLAATSASGAGDAGGGEAAAEAVAEVAEAAAAEAVTDEVTDEVAEEIRESQKEMAASVAEAEAKNAAAFGHAPARRGFIKGNLVHVGTRQMLSRFDHFGASVGPQVLDGNLYARVDPGFAYYGKKFALALHAPLNLLALEGGSLDQPTLGGFKVRREDWDEAPDFGKIIRFLTIGRKEDRLYFSVNTMRPATIGHGMVVDKYQANIDIDRSMTGVLFDAYNDYAGFQLQMNDVTMVNQVMGGLAFLKPLSLFSDHYLATSFSIGAEYITDLRAPKCLIQDPDARTCINGSGHAVGRDQLSGARLDNTFIRSSANRGRFRVKRGVVEVAGISAEMKLYKDDRNVDLKLYGTHHQFMNRGGGRGSAGGILARLNFGERWISAFRVRGELRSFEDGFIPSYFNTLYEVEKYAYWARSRAFQVTPTKYQAIFGDSKNGFARDDFGRRKGFNVEVSWGLFKHSRSNKKLAIGVGVQDSDGPDDSTMYAHIEFPALEILQVFGTVMHFNAKNMNRLFALDKLLNANNSVILAGARLQVLPFLFINAHYADTFRVVRSPGSEYHLGNGNVVDAHGSASAAFLQDELFENVPNLTVEVELGWEFDLDEGGI